MLSPRRSERPHSAFGAPVDVTIRRAAPADDAGLARLAALDGARPLAGPVLVAEVAGELWAAVSLAGDAIADPFRPTAELLGLLRTRAEQLAGTGRARRIPLRRLVPALR